MRVASIDQSFKKSAMILWEDGEPKESMVFKCADTGVKHKLKSTRYFDTVDKKIDYIVGCHYDSIMEWEPRVVIMEGLSFGSAGNATRDLAGLYFTLRNVLFNDGFEWSQLPTVGPSQLKAFARKSLPVEKQTVPKPNGKKGTNLVKMKERQMCEAVLPEHRWIYDGYVISPQSEKAGKDDLADAYHIGMYYHQILKGG